MSDATPPPPPSGQFPPAPTPPPTPPGPSSAGPAAPTSDKSLIARIFDLSFSEYITPSIIKIVFVVGIIMSGFVSLAVFAGFASRGGGGVVLGLIFAPVVFFFYVLIARVVSEVYLILFRIEENTRPR
jgi:hypothetical protein